MVGARGKTSGWCAAAVAIALVVTVSLLSGCRVGPFNPDAARAPFPDAAVDVAGEAAAGAPCDLLAQDCPDKQTCYPVDDHPGQTKCEMTGSAPPSTSCMLSVECDAREACVFVAETLMNECATICDPSAVPTGCLPRATCREIPGYSAGFCVP
jgi:hypothetical protein